MQKEITRNEILIFAVLWVTLAYFYQAGGHNEAARFDTIRAFLECGELWIDAYAYNTADTIEYGNHIFSNKAPGTMYFGLLPFLVFKTLLGFLGVSQNLKYHLTCYLTTVFTVSLFSALGSVYLYRFLLAKTGNASQALTIALIISLGSMSFPFGTMFFSHQLTASLLFLSFYSIFRVKEDTNAKSNQRWLVIGGLSGGLAVVTEYPAVIGLFWICCYAICAFKTNNKWSFVWTYVISVAVGLIPLVVYNHFAFHDLLYIPYEAYTPAPGEGVINFAKGFLGIPNPLSNPHFFSALKEVTVMPYRGIFWTSPVLLLIVPGFALGFWNAFKKRQLPLELILAIMIFSSHLAFNANLGGSIVHWEGGYSFGPRHVVAALPFLGLPLWWAHQNKYLRPVLTIAAYISIGICLMATSVEPRLPYDFAHPIRDFLLPHYLRGQFALSTWGIFSNQWTVGRAVSFNLGRWMGLPGTLELLPLGALWIGSLWYLSRRDFLVRRSYVYVFLCVLFLTPVAYSTLNRSDTSKDSGLLGTYYRGKDFTGRPVLSANDGNVFFDWTATSPLEPPFSVEWIGQIHISLAEEYGFFTKSDGPSWLWIDDKLVVHNDGTDIHREISGSFNLLPGRHRIRIRYRTVGKNADMKVYWRPPLGTLEPIPIQVLSSPNGK